jgi:hypothetical protein
VKQSFSRLSYVLSGSKRREEEEEEEEEDCNYNLIISCVGYARVFF